MKLWTKHHRALLNALNAQQCVPKLVARLSLERCSASSDDVRLLRDWAASLKADPGWAVLEAHLDRPRAFPQAWHRAVHEGFSGRSDHHHALLFARFCDDLVDAQDFEVARYAWGECVEAWLRVFGSGYADTLLEKLSATSKTKTNKQTRQNLLIPLSEARERDLQRALGLDQTTPSERFDHRLTRFGWRALESLDQKLSATDLEHDALSGLSEHVNGAMGRIRSKLLSRFGKMVEGLELSDEGFETISRPFEWISEVFTILPIDATAAARVADATVTVGWKLRKLDFDRSDALLTHLLGLASPFNERLAGFIESGEAFGQNSTCADFFVFQGEQSDDDGKREHFFEHALEACPGHRNASMMLSYEKLREVSQLLLRIRLMPAAVRMVPGASERVESSLQDASALLDAADSLFPSNENIAEYRQQIVAEANRLGVSEQIL